MKLRMGNSPISSKFNGFQHATRISLKQSMLKIGHFVGRPETALGTEGRMIVFNDLHIGHLSKEQEVALDGAATIGAGGSLMESHPQF